MAFCPQCGTNLQGEVKFCPACGTPVAPAATASQAPPSRGYEPPVIPGAPAQADIRDAQENKAMAILAYIFFFIPLLAGAHKTSPFVRYHTNQGTVLFLFAAALGIVVGILTSILGAILLGSLGLFSGGGIFGILMFLFWLLFLIPLFFCIAGIINAANGRMRPLPLIGRFTLIK